MISENCPNIVYGLRGLAYFELRVFGPSHDLHSGSFGGSVLNPANALCELIAGMHDEDYRVTLPGFYDKVRSITPKEHDEFKRLPMDEAYYLTQTGAPALWGESGFLPAERVGARPTLDVNGFLTGFTEKGSKTVIPARAMAKISMRLVPDQDASEVKSQLEAYLHAHAPSAITWELEQMASGPACATDPFSKASNTLFRALEETWGVKPAYKREGGSVPIVGEMQRILGFDSVLTGFGLPEDNVHSPNERLHLATFFKGIDALIRSLITSEKIINARRFFTNAQLWWASFDRGSLDARKEIPCSSIQNAGWEDRYSNRGTLADLFAPIFSMAFSTGIIIALGCHGARFPISHHFGQLSNRRR